MCVSALRSKLSLYFRRSASICVQSRRSRRVRNDKHRTASRLHRPVAIRSRRTDVNELSPRSGGSARGLGCYRRRAKRKEKSPTRCLSASEKGGNPRQSAVIRGILFLTAALNDKQSFGDWCSHDNAARAQLRVSSAPRPSRREPGPYDRRRTSDIRMTDAGAGLNG